MNAVAKKLLPAADDNKLVILSGPVQADFKMPTNNELLALVDKAATVDVKPYEDKAIASTLMERRPGGRQDHGNEGA